MTDIENLEDVAKLDTDRLKIERDDGTFEPGEWMLKITTTDGQHVVAQLTDIDYWHARGEVEITAEETPGVPTGAPDGTEEGSDGE